MIKKVFLPLLVVAGAISLFMFMTAQRPAPEKKSTGAQAMLVEVESVTSRSVAFEIESRGTVQPRTQTTLVSELSGKIVAVAPDFVVGGFFEEGDLLLQIDPSDYEVAVKRAEAALASREAQLSEQVARSEQARLDWEKLGRTGEPGSLVLRIPQLDEARANVVAARADLTKARRDLERTSIRAPYAGLVREKRVDIGQYVTPGTQLGQTFAVDRAEIRLPIPERELAFVGIQWIGGSAADHPLARVRATVGGREIQRQVTIVRTEGVIDVDTRVLYAVAEVPDPYGLLGGDEPKLPIGTFVRAAIEGRRASDVIVLPRHAVRGDNTVLVADPDDRLAVRSVEVIRAERDQVFIAAGIRDGDRIVTSSIEVPVPGTALRIAGEDPGERDTAVAVVGEQP